MLHRAPVADVVQNPVTGPAGTGCDVVGPSQAEARSSWLGQPGWAPSCRTGSGLRDMYFYTFRSRTMCNAHSLVACPQCSPSPFSASSFEMAPTAPKPCRFSSPPKPFSCLQWLRTLLQSSRFVCPSLITEDNTGSTEGLPNEAQLGKEAGASAWGSSP